MNIWPITLPRLTVVGIFQFTDPDVIERSQFDVGPAQTRPRTSFAPTPITLGHPALTNEQAKTLRDFYKITLGRGALTFQMPNPLPGEEGDALFRFTAPIEWSPSANNVWRAVCRLEIFE